MNEKKGVRTQHPDYFRMLPIWEKCNDAAEGEHVIHGKGEKYLPKLKGEEPDPYNARLKRTPFFNATWRTISGLKGMMFRKAPLSKVPGAIQAYMDDIDMAGTPMDLFAQKLAEHILTPGRVGILVDYPKVKTEGMTVAQAAALGVRPMMQMYRAIDIINWKVERINGRIQFSRIVLMEMADVESEDEFANGKETRYRVLDLVNGMYRQRLFRISKDDRDEQIDGDIFPQMNSKPLNAIPFWIVGADQISAEIVSPPLLDLVSMNFKHYTVSADYEHGCHYSGLPTLFVFGFSDDPNNPKPIYLGGPAANCIASPDGHAEYAQVQGGFEALQHNLESKERQMAVLGARMLEQQKSAVESAETQKQRVAGESSQLAALANVLSMAIVQALTVFAEWAGAKGDIEYQICTDFMPVRMSPEELTALMLAWQAGGISKQTLFNNLKTGEIVDDGVTFEEEQERIASDPPNLVTPEEMAA